jgi:Ser/Thr protein kinase RdoA (MazF antagonist)
MSGNSLLAADNSLWQLEPWLPGTAISRESPNSVISAAMEVIAGMHLASRAYLPTDQGSAWFTACLGTPPAIGERIQQIRSWTPQRLLHVQQQLSNAPAWLQFPAAEILAHFAVRSRPILEQLREFEGVEVSLQPCFRDLWRGHLLVDDHGVTGLIDAAAARTDHAGSDLSRFLGSLYEEDFELWNAAIQVYEHRCPLAEKEHRLLRILDRSNVLLSGMTWINRWWNAELPHGQDQAVRQRLDNLLRRMQHLR